MVDRYIKYMKTNNNFSVVLSGPMFENLLNPDLPKACTVILRQLWLEGSNDPDQAIDIDNLSTAVGHNRDYLIRYTKILLINGLIAEVKEGRKKSYFIPKDVLKPINPPQFENYQLKTQNGEYEVGVSK